jgi:hypothetical protein
LFVLAGVRGVFVQQSNFGLALNIARICAAKYRAARLACQDSEKLVPLHPQPTQAIFSLYLQHGLKLYTTLAQRSEPFTQHDGQQERWAYWYGRHGQDVCPAVEQRWLEVSTSRDNLDTIASSFAFGKSNILCFPFTFMMTVSAFGSSMARVHAVAVLVSSTWARRCP